MTPFGATERFAKGWAWALFTAALVVGFVVIGFPYDRLHAMLQAEMLRRTGWELQTRDWTIAGPASVSWQGVTVSRGGRQFQAEGVDLRIGLWEWWRGQPNLQGTLRLKERPEGPGGRIVSRLALTGDEAHLTGTVERVDLAALRVPGLQEGTFRAEFDQRWKDLGNEEAFIRGDGLWRLEMTEVRAEGLAIAGITAPALRLSTLSARLQCSGGLCQIEEVQGQGPDGTATGEGRLSLRLPLQASEVALSLVLKPGEQLQRQLDPAGALGPAVPFKLQVHGPLSQLQVRL